MLHVGIWAILSKHDPSKKGPSMQLTDLTGSQKKPEEEMSTRGQALKARSSPVPQLKAVATSRIDYACMLLSKKTAGQRLRTSG